MQELTYTIVLEPAEEGGYNVSVPALPGCFTQGDTYEEALAMAEDAITLWLETLAADGQPIPQEESEPEVRLARVQVAAPTNE
ncbi:MAG: type II toxin-antitoxin system HicB family antitoxin [Candidatus Hydrogenedentota bacterium]